MQVHLYTPIRGTALEPTAPISRTEGFQRSPFSDAQRFEEEQPERLRTQHQRLEEKEGFVVLTTLTEERLELGGRTLETRTESSSQRLEPIAGAEPTDPAQLRAELLASEGDQAHSFRLADQAREAQRPLDPRRVLSLLADT